MSKRIFDLFFSGLGLLMLAPVFMLIAVAIKVDSRGPVFFRQERIGRGGVPFFIHKFRTMLVDAESRGLQLTTGNDARITRTGKWLRKYKLDELAQLIDVFQGTMSLVGPRPEVPKYVALYSESDKAVVLSVRPGITDFASIEFKDENDMLSASENPERTYVEEILPIKIRYCRKYVQSQSVWMDFVLILRTLRAIAK